MQGVFHCTSCGAALTGAIMVLSTKDPAVTPPLLKDAEPVCDPGMAFKSHEPLQRAHDPANPAPLDFTPPILGEPGGF